VRFPRVLLALVLACAALVAGCGGGTKIYDADKSEACVRQANLRVGPPPPGDLVASAAEGGAFTAHLGDNTAVVSFGNDRAGAERIVRAYQHFVRNPHLDDILKVKSNAVMLWAVGPTDNDAATIEGCLK
jgi:alkanesulfonate monooxygenase SsuD/methylene tetrahydromethanopterin reductase-like flavin-dependent oxidoreductase (luciferase family)